MITVFPSKTTTFYAKPVGGCYPSNQCGSFTIYVNPKPTINITVTPNDTVCKNTKAKITATGAKTYLWSGGIITNDVFFTAVNSTSFYLTATDSNKCVSYATQPIYVETDSNLILNVVAHPNDSVCEGNPVLLHASGNCANYVWQNNIVDSVLFTPLTTFTYSVVATSPAGCSVAATQKINVLKLPVVIPQILPNDTVCQYTWVNIKATGANIYNWSGGITNDVPFSAFQTTTYTVIGSTTFGCFDTNSISLTVNPAASSSISATQCGPYISPTGNYVWGTTGNYVDTVFNPLGCDSVIFVALTILADTTVSFTSPNILTSNAANAQYQWYDCNTWTPILNANTQTYTPTVSGNYAVVVSQNNCVDTSSCFNITNAGISANNFTGNVWLYPNPTTGNISIKFEINQERINYNLSNALGEVLINNEVNNTKEISFGIKYPTGVYYLKVVNKKFESMVFKVLKL